MGDDATCKACGGPLPATHRHYCSAKCAREAARRAAAYYQRYGYPTSEQRKRGQTLPHSRWELGFTRE